MTVSSDVGSIRAIQWKEVIDSIDDYLRDQTVMISTLEKENEALQKEIQRQKAAAVSKVLSEEQIQELVKGSVSAEGSYGSVETAKNTACGKPGRKPRVSSLSMEVATENVASLARPLLSEGTFKSSKGTFIDICKIFLDAGDDELENYCGPLCTQLAGVVQGVSDQHSNAVKSTARLEKLLAERNLVLLEARNGEKKCQQSREKTVKFQEYLGSLDEEITVRHTAVRKAESELDDALWALDDLEQNLATQKQLVSDATNLLTGSQAVVQQAKGALEDVQNNENDLIEQLGTAKDLVSQLREELSNMNKASQAVLEIKKKVSQTSWAMEAYVDTTVREPVRSIGLAEGTDVHDYFSENCSTDFTDFREELTDFHQYCTGPAMVAFKTVEKYIDLTPICTLHPESEIATEVDKAVQTRSSLLVKALQNVQSWLDPFKGMPMTVELEQQKVDAGEPDGLRHVMAVYGNINFYRGYLKDWKMDHGKFHELLKQLTDEKEVLEKNLKKEENSLQLLNDTLTAASNSRKDAKQKLDVALADEDAAIESKAELEKVMQSLEAQVGDTNNQLKDLQEVLNQAIRLWREARTYLVSEHKAGKDGILALSQVHEGVLNH